MATKTTTKAVPQGQTDPTPAEVPAWDFDTLLAEANAVIQETGSATFPELYPTPDEPVKFAKLTEDQAKNAYQKFGPAGMKFRVCNKKASEDGSERAVMVIDMDNTSEDRKRKLPSLAPRFRLLT